MNIENAKKAIELLEAINPHDEYAYEKAILAYSRTMIKVPVITFRLPPKLSIFRARTHDKNDRFSHISEVLAAPQSAVKYFARCNRPFQSKFYCSENRPTSYMELAEDWARTKNVGDKVYVTIGKWILKTGMEAIIVTTPDPEKRISEFDTYHGQAFDQYINSFEPKTKEAAIYFYRYLFDKFREQAKPDNNTYIITSAYCNLALAADNRASGIYYPSVPFNEQGVNFALNTKFATFENLELIHVMRTTLDVSMNENHKLSFKENDSIEATKLDTTKDEIQW